MSHRLTKAEEDRLDGDQFDFPRQRKEPLVDASHVRSAIARLTR